MILFRVTVRPCRLIRVEYQRSPIWLLAKVSLSYCHFAIIKLPSTCYNFVVQNVEFKINTKGQINSALVNRDRRLMLFEFHKLSHHKPERSVIMQLITSVLVGRPT